MGPMEGTNWTVGTCSYLLPLAVWPTGVLLATVGVMAAFGVSLGVVLATSLSTHLSPPRSATHPTHPLYYQY